MFTIKVLAVFGLASAMMLGAATEASANPWRGPHLRPVVVPAYRAPVYRAPVYPVPIYRAPVVYAPVYRAPVYCAPVYGGPVWRHHAWVHGYSHGHGHRW